MLAFLKRFRIAGHRKSNLPRTIAQQQREPEGSRQMLPRQVKQYLDKMIAHCERLAGKVEQPASRPRDWRGCLDKPQPLHRRIVPRLPSSSITTPAAFRVAGDAGIVRHWD